MTTGSTRALRQRLSGLLDGFRACFGRRPQRHAASAYLAGVFDDSERKSAQATHGRLSDPVSYQALQYAITQPTRDAAHV